MPTKLKTHNQRLRAQRPRSPDDRPSPWKRGYDDRWRKLRQRFLARHPLCAHCAEVGLTRPAAEVDHITPIRMNGPRLDETNLQPLCKSCHSRKTAREQHRT